MDVAENPVGFIGKKLLTDYVSFLDTSNIISSAAAFVVGITANNFLATLTDETIGKILGVHYDLSETRLLFGEIEINYGLILTSLINLIAISFTIFLIISASKKFLGFT